MQAKPTFSTEEVLEFVRLIAQSPFDLLELGNLLKEERFLYSYDDLGTIRIAFVKREMLFKKEDRVFFQIDQELVSQVRPEHGVTIHGVIQEGYQEKHSITRLMKTTLYQGDKCKR